MAQSRSASGTKKNTSAKKKARKPIRREVGSVVCLALGLFTLIGYFVRDYWLIDWLCLYVFKGLFGWGFLVVPLCFLWAAAILGFHRGRPVAGRIVALSFIRCSLARRSICSYARPITGLTGFPSAACTTAA